MKSSKYFTMLILIRQYLQSGYAGSVAILSELARIIHENFSHICYRLNICTVLPYI